MKHYEKLSIFFKSKALSQTEVGQKLGYSRSSMSKFLKGDSVIDSNFILKVLKEFPDVDLKEIYSEDRDTLDVASEPGTEYKKEDSKLESMDRNLEEVQEILSKMRNDLAQIRHNK